MYLKRYHEVTISVSGVWRILKRLELSRLPASQRYKRYQQRWKRYEKPLPGHQVQIDVKFIAPLQGSRKKHYQFTVIDDCTRLRVLRIYERLNQKTAIQFVDYVRGRLPFRLEQIQTDNGSEFQSAFHWHVQDLGIRHIYIKPATPRLNGKVERSHRIDAEEFYRMLEGVVIDDARVLSAKLQEWEDFYNYHRPHGSLGGQTPYERLKQKTEAQVSGDRQSHTIRATAGHVADVLTSHTIRATEGRQHWVLTLSASRTGRFLAVEAASLMAASVMRSRHRPLRLIAIVGLVSAAFFSLSRFLSRDARGAASLTRGVGRPGASFVLVWIARSRFSTAVLTRGRSPAR